VITFNMRGDMSVALRRVGTIENSLKRRSVARALNRAATTVRAEARKAIRAKYNIQAARVNKIIKIKNANPANLEASVYAKDRRIALAVFGARESRRKGIVSVKVLKTGARKPVQGHRQYAGKPFLMRVGVGRHLGVFQRVTNKRLPIKELFSISIPGALRNKEIGQLLRSIARKRFGDELTRELTRRLGVTR